MKTCTSAYFLHGSPLTRYEAKSYFENFNASIQRLIGWRDGIIYFPSERGIFEQKVVKETK